MPGKPAAKFEHNKYSGGEIQVHWQISRALDWHPCHLASVPKGRMPPKWGEPVDRADKDIDGRLDAFEYRLSEIAEDARSIKAVETRLSGLAEELEVAVERAFAAAPSAAALTRLTW
ncbi:MAG TPA: hypothetical protein VFW65_40575 [Pseudonocardiaceae bacterium]|nr:hypothetical protein [Pseudonocardiaceae bacterium]